MCLGFISFKQQSYLCLFSSSPLSTEIGNEVSEVDSKSISADGNDNDSTLSPPHEVTQLPNNQSGTMGETTKIKLSHNRSTLDPCVFAPTGDIYSYFNRRPMLSSSAITFQYPFRYSTVLALSHVVPALHGT